MHSHQHGHQPEHKEIHHDVPPASSGAFHQHEIEVPAQPVREVKAGDQVLYVLDQGRSAGSVRPAFVVRAWNVLHVNLMVLTDCTNDFESGKSGANGTYWVTSVSYNKDTTVPRSWHWPEE